jgi:hypothetical protein
MIDNLLQDITIYQKEAPFTKYNIRASVRNTSILNRNKTGLSTTDSALIRVFDVDGYNNTWRCKKGDIVVLKAVTDSIEKAPITELRNKYGKEYVIEVSSIDEFVFDNPDIRVINHIKIGGR